MSDAVEAYLSSLWRVVFVAFLLVASFGIPFVVGVCVAGVIWGAWHNLTAVFVATIFSLIASVGLGPVLFCRMILWVLENYWDAPEEPACAGRWRVPPEPGE